MNNVIQIYKDVKNVKYNNHINAYKLIMIFVGHVKKHVKVVN